MNGKTILQAMNELDPKLVAQADVFWQQAPRPRLWWSVVKGVTGSVAAVALVVGLLWLGQLQKPPVDKDALHAGTSGSGAPALPLASDASPTPGKDAVAEITIDKDGRLHFADEQRQRAYDLLTENEYAERMIRALDVEPSPGDEVRQDLPLLLPKVLWTGTVEGRERWLVLADLEGYYFLDGETRKHVEPFLSSSFFLGVEDGTELVEFPHGPGTDLQTDLLPAVREFAGLAGEGEALEILSRGTGASGMGQHLSGTFLQLMEDYARLNGLEEYLPQAEGTPLPLPTPDAEVQGGVPHFDQDGIRNLMLNSVDYFDNAKAAFSVEYPQVEAASYVVLQTDLTTRRAHQAVRTELEDGSFLRQKATSDGKTVTTVNADTGEVLDTVPAVGRAFGKKSPSYQDWVSQERLWTDENGEENFRVREDPTNTSHGGDCLFPQNYAAAFLRDNSLWSVAEITEYLGRECYRLEGTSPASTARAKGVATFTMKVDTRTGILLDYSGYDAAGNRIAYVYVHDLWVDQCPLPIPEETSPEDVGLTWQEAEDAATALVTEHLGQISRDFLAEDIPLKELYAEDIWAVEASRDGSYMTLVLTMVRRPEDPDDLERLLAAVTAGAELGAGQQEDCVLQKMSLMGHRTPEGWKLEDISSDFIYLDPYTVPTSQVVMVNWPLSRTVGKLD